MAQDEKLLMPATAYRRLLVETSFRVGLAEAGRTEQEGPYRLTGNFGRWLSVTAVPVQSTPEGRVCRVEVRVCFYENNGALRQSDDLIVDCDLSGGKERFSTAYFSVLKYAASYVTWDTNLNYTKAVEAAYKLASERRAQ